MAHRPLTPLGKHTDAKVTPIPSLTALVVHDDAQMISAIEFALETQGFRVNIAQSMAAALNALRSQHHDLVVLDTPFADGAEMLRRLRGVTDAPLIVLSDPAHRDQIDGDIYGDTYGADESVEEPVLDSSTFVCLPKPFHPRDLAMHATALTHPVEPLQHNEVLHVGRLRIDPIRLLVTIGDRRVDLPFTEFRLLAHLAAHRGQPQRWSSLLRAIWGAQNLSGGRDVVKAAIYRLRSRLAIDGHRTDYILTLRGSGYLMPDLPPRHD